MNKSALHLAFFLLVFLGSFIFSLSLGRSTVLASCQYKGDGSDCPVNTTFCPAGGQVYCAGTDPDKGGAVCHVCVTITTGGTCSDDSDDTSDDNFNWGFYAEEACKQGITTPCRDANGQETCSTSSSPAVAECLREKAEIANFISNGKCGSVICGGQLTDPFYRGAKYCVAPTCEPNQCYNGTSGSNAACPVCANITCAVNSAIPTSSTTANVTSKVTSDSTVIPYTGYDGVNWYLNSGLIGTTAMDQTTGNASNTFTNLVAGTQYTATAQYFDNDNVRGAVMCTGYQFQFNLSPTGMTCSLTPTYSSIFPGESVKWEITNNPAGASAVWGGTNPDGSQINGPVIGYSNTTSWTDTYTYNDSGSYQRYVQIKDSGGNIKCTTDTSQIFVQAQPPPSLKTCSAGGQTGYCGNSSKQFPQNYSVNCGSGTLTYASSGDSSCSGNYPYCYICLSPQQSTDSCPDETGNPTGGCGNNNYGLLGQCSGTWTYPGIVSKNNYCSQNAGATRPYCYTCTPSSPTGGGPSPSPGPVSAPFTTGSIVVKGPLLLGRIFQDINASFNIDSLDKLIEKITSIVSGKVLTTLGLLDITGRAQNVLAHGAAVFHMWTNDCFGGCTADARAIQQEIITGSGTGASSSSFIPVTGSRKCSSYIINSPSINDPSCSTWPFPNGGYNREFVNTSTPFEGMYQKKVSTGSGSGLNSHSSNTTDMVSHTLSNVKSGSCIGGCTVQSKVTFKGVNGDTHSGSWPAGKARDLNPDGTCFLTEDTSYADPEQIGSTWGLTGPGCSGNTCSYQDYTYKTWSANNGNSQGKYYEGCTKWTFDKNRTEIAPWLVSFTSPVVAGGSSFAVNNWYNLFDIKEVASCSYNSQGQTQVNPSDANQYCTCQLSEWCDTGGCTTSATYDCNFPLKNGSSFGGAPTGDYIFEVAAGTANPIGYTITAGGTLAQGSQSPSGGKLSVKFNVPDSAIGQRIGIELSQTGRNKEEVTFGPPALYPVGWYEANINFGRTATTGLSQARVIDPPDDYPYTIGMIPPSGNYCSKTSNLEQCYLSLSPSTLNSSNITQVDFLLGNIKAGAWFQVKDADLQATGSLVSRVPSSCKTPKCTPSFDLSGSGGFPGIPAYTGASSFGSGTVSSTGWLAKSGYSGRQYNYNYFKGQVAASKFKDLNDGSVGTATPDGLKLTNNDLVSLAGDSEANFAKYDGKVVIDQNTNLEGKKLVLFVGGNLEIKGRINLKAGEGFFAAIVGGSINVDPAVISQNPNQYGLEGIFLADGAIHTGTNNPVPLSGTPDGQLYIRGVIAGWQGVILERDLDPLRENGANNDKPAETIEYAPDLILNLPKELQRQGSVWREIAP